jgi:hypothetical protein
MAYYKATIELLLDVDGEGEACDAIAETLRPLLKEFAGPDSCFVDWKYSSDNGWFSHPKPHSGEGFEYATPQEAS